MSDPTFFPTLITGLLLLGVVALAVRHLWKTRKQGGCTGCSGNCSGCCHCHEGHSQSHSHS
ncbi:MAG TPA: FeoB-associated Cys-rich membrane protein [Candidatus Flavonifractor merdigallinarum]|uniref:FeoB-associated Cys-rich membrane protein n=1 Tax=Candidatus Flavonifractor merdigallinarum TaxID=2838589 RepID=A0A9D1YA17_9FIRM|nr:FeoB-associated Cys-rich membrane protein [Candidatus Flavonifractor merdigallinarum]